MAERGKGLSFRFLTNDKVVIKKKTKHNLLARAAYWIFVLKTRLQQGLKIVVKANIFLIKIKGYTCLRALFDPLLELSALPLLHVPP